MLSGRMKGEAALAFLRQVLLKGSSVCKVLPCEWGCLVALAEHVIPNHAVGELRELCSQFHALAWAREQKQRHNVTFVGELNNLPHTGNEMKCSDELTL